MFFNISSREYVAYACKKCTECDWETKTSKGTNLFYKFFCPSSCCKKGFFFCPFCEFIHEKEAVFINHVNDEHYRVALAPFSHTTCVICHDNIQNNDFISHSQEHVLQKYEEYQSHSFLHNYSPDVVPFVQTESSNQLQNVLDATNTTQNSSTSSLVQSIPSRSEERRVGKECS